MDGLLISMMGHWMRAVTERRDGFQLLNQDRMPQTHFNSHKTRNKQTNKQPKQSHLPQSRLPKFNSQGALKCCLEDSWPFKIKNKMVSQIHTTRRRHVFLKLNFQIWWVPEQAKRDRISRSLLNFEPVCVRSQTHRKKIPGGNFFPGGELPNFNYLKLKRLIKPI